MDELRHECGIAALYHLPAAIPSSLAPHGKPDLVPRLMPRMLLDLQNRGQLASGMSSYNPLRDQIINTHKEIGTVIEGFRLNHQGKFDAIMNENEGPAAIGHTRYATSGKNTRSFAQPFERRHGNKWKWFTFAFNGQLANFPQLRKELLSHSSYHLTKNNDTEIIMHTLAHALRGDSSPDLFKVFREMSSHFDGSYNIVFMNALGDMMVMRDPLGIRPLCWATEGPLFGAASESVPLTNLGFREIHNVEPGEMILISNGKIARERIGPKQKSAHCFFEWIYFANVASSLDERSVYLSRSALGHELAKQERLLGRVDLDPATTIVVPVPDTGKAAADAMAFDLGIPTVEGLMRNRHIGRTFIEGSNRLDKVRLKYTPLREVMNGKKVLLIEDSIVRSTTLQSLLTHIRERGGAKEIHVRVACPPIIAPCFYGIDMSTRGELWAPKFMAGLVPTVAEQDIMAKELKADSLFYLPKEALARCIGLPEDSLCRACVTGEYPTPAGEQLYQLSLLETEGGGRTYELPLSSDQKRK